MTDSASQQAPKAGSSKSKSPSWFVIIGVALIARVALNNWLTASPRTPANFPPIEELDVREIPVVYYDNLTHLTDFVQDFVIYRAKNKFVIDNVEELFGDELIRAKTIDPECDRETVICTPCFKNAFAKDGVAFTNVSAALKPDSGVYASFAKISNEGATKMWNLMGASFHVNNKSLEHAFISNLREPMVTAPFHAASTLLSMSVQLLGHKTWIFVSRYDYITKWGAIPAAGVMLPKFSPKKMKVYLYTSQPGDILFFPATYAHAVYTHPGPNLMVNYRKVTLESIFAQPLTFAQGLSFALGNALAEMAVGTYRKRHADDKAPLLQPEQMFNRVAYSKLENACDAMDGKALPIDEQLIKLFKSASTAHKQH